MPPSIELVLLLTVEPVMVMVEPLPVAERPAANWELLPVIIELLMVGDELVLTTPPPYPEVRLPPVMVKPFKVESAPFWIVTTVVAPLPSMIVEAAPLTDLMVKSLLSIIRSSVQVPSATMMVSPSEALLIAA